MKPFFAVFVRKLLGTYASVSGVLCVFSPKTWADNETSQPDQKCTLPYCKRLMRNCGFLTFIEAHAVHFATILVLVFCIDVTKTQYLLRGKYDVFDHRSILTLICTTQNLDNVNKIIRQYFYKINVLSVSSNAQTSHTADSLAASVYLNPYDYIAIL